MAASIRTRAFSAGSRSSTSLKNAIPNSPTSSLEMAVMRVTAASGSVSVKSGSGAAPARTSGAPLSMVKWAGPPSSARLTRAPLASGRVALRAAGALSKNLFRDS